MNSKNIDNNHKKPLTPMQEKLRSNSEGKQTPLKKNGVVENVSKSVQNTKHCNKPKPSLIPTSTSKFPSKRTNDLISKTPDSKKKTESKNTTPEKPLTKNAKLAGDQELLEKMNVKKALNNFISASGEKPKTSKKETYLEKMISKTPAPDSSKKKLIFAKNAKFDPDFETGIPWIKPKKTTKTVPFKFATSELVKLRQQKG